MIKGASEVLIRDYKGKVPDKMEELIKLPGVGRKTANAILINAFDKIEGITVDTHVIRVSYRLGLTKHKDPALIEKDLMTSAKDLVERISVSHEKSRPRDMQGTGSAVQQVPGKLSLSKAGRYEEIVIPIGIFLSGSSLLDSDNLLIE
jgi:endonuclease III-like uncharacterized protein